MHGEYVPGTFALARDQVAAFEANNGAGGTNPAGAPIIILASVGAKTG